MKTLVQQILKKELGLHAESITEILDFGSVNNVFDVICQANHYIVRINADKHKKLEFLKEEWCIKEIRKLGLSTPKIFGNGVINGYPYMIQEKIEGQNGSTLGREEKNKIWKHLGACALKYHEIEEIEIPELQAAEFHDNWKSKLEYNIDQLSPEDTLLTNQVFSVEAHAEIKRALISLREGTFKVGLVHGDLSPRNVIVNDDSTYLIDWGTASINIVPYNEIGIILIEGEANEEEFRSFLAGMSIEEETYRKMEPEIRKSNLLHRLDKYRWATDYDVENLKRYTDKIRQEYTALMILNIL